MDLAERLIAEVYENLSNFASDVYIQISHLVERYQPLVMKYVHEVEAAVYSVINKILGTNFKRKDVMEDLLLNQTCIRSFFSNLKIDFFYETKQAVQQSPYYQKLEKLVKDMDAIFTDISKNDLATNFQKYFGILKGFMGRKIKEICDLRKCIREKKNQRKSFEILSTFFFYFAKYRFVAWKCWRETWRSDQNHFRNWSSSRSSTSLLPRCW